jgi:hypothetical protein
MNEQNPQKLTNEQIAENLRQALESYDDELANQKQQKAEIGLRAVLNLVRPKQDNSGDINSLCDSLKNKNGQYDLESLFKGSAEELQDLYSDTNATE